MDNACTARQALAHLTRLFVSDVKMVPGHLPNKFYFAKNRLLDDIAIAYRRLLDDNYRCREQVTNANESKEDDKHSRKHDF